MDTGSIVMMRKLWIMLIPALIWTGCESTGMEPEYEEQLVVSAYLRVGEPIDSVSISRTFTLESRYTEEEAGVSEARVSIRVDDKEYTLREYDDRNGFYHLPDKTVRVRPGATYELLIDYQEHHLAGVTTAPSPVNITSVNADTLPFMDPDRFAMNWDKADGADGYLVTTQATPWPEKPYAGRLADYGVEGIVDFQLAQFGGDTLQAFSPISQYGVDGLEQTIEFPWHMFSWYGKYTVKVYAITSEYLDLLTTQNQTGAFEDPVYNIEGGLGIFTALSMDSVTVVVQRNQ